MKIIGNRVISIVECLFIDERDSSVIVMHTRQHEAGQENALMGRPAIEALNLLSRVYIVSSSEEIFEYILTCCMG